jgi:hypothetical protein
MKGWFYLSVQVMWVELNWKLLQLDTHSIVSDEGMSKSTHVPMVFFRFWWENVMLTVKCFLFKQPLCVTRQQNLSRF